MTFVEIATSIDKIKDEIKFAAALVKTAETVLTALKAKHAEEIAAANDSLTSKVSAHRAILAKLQDLYAELHAMMGQASTQTQAPLLVDLKQLYLDGQKTRG